MIAPKLLISTEITSDPAGSTSLAFRIRPISLYQQILQHTIIESIKGIILTVAPTSQYINI